MIQYEVYYRQKESLKTFLKIYYKILSILGLQMPEMSHLGGAFKTQSAKFGDGDHLAIFFSSEDRRSPRDCEQKDHRSVMP